MRIAQIAGLAFLLLFLPVSNYFMSLASFWLVGVWMLDIITDVVQKRNLSNRLNGFVQKKAAWWPVILYFFLLVGMAWSDDFQYGLWDLRMKLPLLFMPIVLSTMRPVSQVQFQNLLKFFLAVLTVTISICLLVYLRVLGKSWTDVRPSATTSRPLPSRLARLTLTPG